MAEEKKETVEAEVVSEEEKKEGKFGKWWKGACYLQQIYHPS